jgi:hypothetical protein
LPNSWSVSECIALLVQCRPSVRPNLGFQSQLKQWARTKLHTYSHPDSLDEPNVPPPSISSATVDIGTTNSGQESNTELKQQPQPQQQPFPYCPPPVPAIVEGSAFNLNFKTCPEEHVQLMKFRLERMRAQKKKGSHHHRGTAVGVLVLPGSFNPIHRGHIQCLEVSKKHLESQVCTDDIPPPPPLSLSLNLNLICSFGMYVCPFFSLFFFFYLFLLVLEILQIQPLNATRNVTYE